MVDTSHTPPLGVMTVVASRTLLPLHIRPGTIVWRAAYNFWPNNIIRLNLSGVHTQNMESYWNRVKTKIKRMKGCHRQMLSSYLGEFMWREHHGQTALNNLCRDIALTAGFQCSCSHHSNSGC